MSIAFVERVENVFQTPTPTMHTVGLKISVNLNNQTQVGGVIQFDGEWGADWRSLARQAILQWGQGQLDILAANDPIVGILFPDLTAI